MKFTVTIEVEAERVTGKFASWDELAEQLGAEVEGAAVYELFGENEGEYEVTNWDVTVERSK